MNLFLLSCSLLLVAGVVNNLFIITSISFDSLNLFYRQLYFLGVQVAVLFATSGLLCTAVSVIRELAGFVIVFDYHMFFH